MSSLKVKFSAGRCLELHGKKLDKWTLQQLINHARRHKVAYSKGGKQLKKDQLFKKLCDLEKSRRRKSPRRKSPKRKSPRRKSPKRKSPRRKSPRRKSPKRKSPKRKSPKRKSPRRKSPKPKCSHRTRPKGWKCKETGKLKQPYRDHKTNRCHYCYAKKK